jgi:hypothetical protein
LAVLLAGAEGADTGTVVGLIRDGSAITLSEAERAQIARRVETLMVGCAMTSVTAPDLFAARALARDWHDVRAGSHRYVRFPAPLRAERGGVEISEVVVGLEDPSFRCPARPAPPPGEAESQLLRLRPDRRPAGERVEPGG